MTKIVDDFMSYVQNIESVYAQCTEEEKQHRQISLAPQDNICK